jgi:ribosomal protein L14E/L6E/L27E
VEVELVVELGRILKANTGRDKNNYFILTGIIDEEYIYIANGKKRKISLPKKKKIKHVTDTGRTSKLLNEKLSADKKVKNAELRKVLDDFLENDNKF